MDTIDKIKAHVGLNDDLWLAIEALTGSVADQPKDLSTLPGQIIHDGDCSDEVGGYCGNTSTTSSRSAADTSRSGQGGISVAHRAQAGWDRPAGNTYESYPDEAPTATVTSALLPSPALPASNIAVLPGSLPAPFRKVKSSLVIDQSDESEFLIGSTGFATNMARRLRFGKESAVPARQGAHEGSARRA